MSGSRTCFVSETEFTAFDELAVEDTLLIHSLAKLLFGSISRHLLNEERASEGRPLLCIKRPCKFRRPVLDGYFLNPVTAT